MERRNGFTQEVLANAIAYARDDLKIVKTGDLVVGSSITRRSVDESR